MPPSLSSYSSQALLTFPPSLPLWSNTKENLGKQLKLGRTRGQEPTLPLYLYSPNSGFDEVLGSSLVPSHCVTTSRPAAATQTRARVCPAMHPKVFLPQMPFLLQPSLFPGLWTCSECWLVYSETRLR